MLEQRIQQQFFESADLKYQSAETLARPVAEAAQALLGAITGGGKVLVYAAGMGSALALHFQRLLLGRFERERLPLAAVALGTQAVEQVRALGLPGDVLLLVDNGEGESAPLIAAARPNCASCSPKATCWWPCRTSAARVSPRRTCWCCIACATPSISS